MAHSKSLTARRSRDASDFYLSASPPPPLSGDNAFLMPSRLPWSHERTKSNVHYARPTRWFRRPVYIVFTVLLVFVVASLLLLPSDSLPLQKFVSTSNHTSSVESDSQSLPSLNASPSVLKGPPASSFRDNLLTDKKYITGWVGGGWTNDFMTYINMAYIGIISQRIPIIPPFQPTHVGQEAGLIAFGDVFDVPRMSRALGIPILEWRDVKTNQSQGHDIEPLGCWTAWAPVDDMRSGLPRQNGVEHQLGLDISYTNVPASAKLKKDEPNEKHFGAFQLGRLGYPTGHREGVNEGTVFESTGPSKLKLEPDNQLLCFDFLYYVSVLVPWEWQEDYSPAWQVATHVHWAPRMTDLANEYLMRLFNVAEVGEIPPFITIHARHGDFKGQCGDVPLNECFAPLSTIDRRVHEIQDELQSRFANPMPGNIPVVMTSDESDPVWWEEVRSFGWLFVDHGANGENTKARYGAWYPPLLDAVIQSMGMGMVGTEGSTMSIVALRRVQDWNNGPTRLVNWRKPGADDH